MVIRSLSGDDLMIFILGIVFEAHLDHFHAPSLARLPKHIPVLAPDDRLTLAALKEFGFTNIRPMKRFEFR